MPKRGPTSGKDALGVSLLAGLLATVDEVIEESCDVRVCDWDFCEVDADTECVQLLGGSDPSTVKPALLTRNRHNHATNCNQPS